MEVGPKCEQKCPSRKRPILLLHEEGDEDLSILGELPRPRVRADCLDVPRPCPFVSCRYNLFLDVGPNGSLRSNFREWDPELLDPSMCALDHAERGGLTLQEVGHICKLTRERVRQLVEKSAAKLSTNRRLILISEPPSGIRRVLRDR
jgi:hypothetical protein